MDTSILLGKQLDEAKVLLEKNLNNTFSYELIKVLSPKNDILGQDERVIKVAKKDKLIIYYSLF